MSLCKSFGCTAVTSNSDDFCTDCVADLSSFPKQLEVIENGSLAEKYPQYFKPVGTLTEIDVYAVHHLFNIQDPSGCLHHSSKKILLSGVRTGGKSAYKDIKEAKDTLTRWLQLNKPE